MMVSVGKKGLGRFVQVGLLASGLLLLTPAMAADGALAGLTGSWGGGGVIKYSDGSSERMRCNARYSGGGAAMAMTISCSGARNVNISGSLKANGSRISGSWSESNLGVSGSASGKAGPGSLSLGLGGSVSGSMAVSYSGSHQSVNISVAGAPLQSVSMSLAKR
jgi:hypothetical protein